MISVPLYMLEICSEHMLLIFNRKTNYKFAIRQMLEVMVNDIEAPLPLQVSADSPNQQS